MSHAKWVSEILIRQNKKELLLRKNFQNEEASSKIGLQQNQSTSEQTN